MARGTLLERARGAFTEAVPDLATSFGVLEELGELTRILELAETYRRELVHECERRTYSWAQIGTALGTTRQAAWEKYSR